MFGNLVSKFPLILYIATGFSKSKMQVICFIYGQVYPRNLLKINQGATSTQQGGVYFKGGWGCFQGQQVLDPTTPAKKRFKGYFCSLQGYYIGIYLIYQRGQTRATRVGIQYTYLAENNFLFFWFLEVGVFRCTHKKTPKNGGWCT